MQFPVLGHENTVDIVQGIQQFDPLIQSQGKAGGAEAVPVHRLFGNDRYLNQTVFIGKSGPRIEYVMVIHPILDKMVLYEEGLDSNTLDKSVRYIRQADMLIIGGTSLVVYPAAGLIDYYRGSKLVLINKDATARDSQADLVINGRIGEVLGAVTGVQ